MLLKTTSKEFYQWWLKNFFWFRSIKNAERNRVKRIGGGDNRAEINRAEINRAENNRAEISRAERNRVDFHALKFRKMIDDFFLIVWKLFFIWKYLFIIWSDSCIFVIFDVSSIIRFNHRTSKIDKIIKHIDFTDLVFDI